MGSRLALLPLLAAGCFKPSYPEGLACAAGAEPCPPGMTCGPDNRCHSPAPDLDGSSSVDGARDAPVADAYVCNQAVTRPLERYLHQDAALEGAGPLTITVPDGYRVSGTVTLPGGPPAATATTSGNVRLFDGAQSYGLTGLSTTGQSFAYTLGVPAGNYTLHAELVSVVMFGADANVVTSQREMPITVCGDTTADVTLPSLGSLRMVQVDVTGFDKLPPIDQTHFGLLEIALANADVVTRSNRSASGPMPFPLPATLLAPPVELTPTVTTSSFVGNLGDYLSAFKLAPQAASTSYSLAIPDVATLTGMIADPSGVIVAGTGSSVTCINLSDVVYLEFMIGYLQPVNLGYRSFLEIGHSCTILASYQVRFPGNLPDAGPTASVARIDDPASLPAPTTFAGDLNRNFTAPALVEPVEVEVRLEDVRGQPLAGYLVSAFTEPSTGPLAGKRLTAAAPFTDPSGTVRLLVMPGTYDVDVYRLLVP